jgi:hypothetical protein
MTMSDGGKGSTPRPRSIADVEWANRWNSIFGRDSVEMYKLSVDVDKDRQFHTKEKEDKDGQGLGSGDLPEHIHLHSDRR